MKIDLREVFEPVTKISQNTNPITTIICDVYDTLIDKHKNFNEPLAEFLKWADENGATVMIVSSLKEDAERDIRRLDTKGLLSGIAIHDKLEIQSLIFRDDLQIAAVDDQISIWLGAAIMVTPTDGAFKKLLTEKSYRDRGLTP